MSVTKGFTIGTDPEFFMRERETGKLVSAIPHVEGTKYEPKILPDGGNIQRDNVAVEIATDPAKTMEEFVANIRKTLHGAVKTLPGGTVIEALASATFDQDQLEHPEAQAFGCDPDFDAYEVAQNEPPVAQDVMFRSCGAHIHVGTNGSDGNEFLLEFAKKLEVVKVMDCFHGIISVILDNNDESVKRRELYGKPGAHRPKPYGVEYRVLSNFWLKSPVTVSLMYCLTKDVLDVVRSGKGDELIEAITVPEIKRIIMTGDADAAASVIEKHVFDKLSEEFVFYYNEALAKVRANDMNFHGEWELYKEAR